MKIKAWLGLITLVAAGTAHADTVAYGLAQYVVPAAEAGNAPATYPVGEAAIATGSTGQLELVFSLPEDLVGPGHEQTILTGVPSASAFALFSNADITASCSLDGDHAVCVLKYVPTYGQELNRTAIDAFLGGKYAGSALLPDALAHSRQFQKDPEGVLIF
jgi:hypothetical protein